MPQRTRFQNCAIGAALLAFVLVNDSSGLGGSPACPWDCESVPDGGVGVTDLLALLGQWGASDSCDVDGRGVGVTDFLDVLGNWGPCPCAPGSSFLARDDAIAAVLAQVISGHPDESVLVAYSHPVALGPGTLVGPGVPEDGPVMTVSRCSWLFYLDLAPDVKFAHPAQFVLVSGAAASATIEITEQFWWPSIDGQDVFVDPEANDVTPDRFFGERPGLDPQCANACITTEVIKNAVASPEGPAPAKLWGITTQGPGTYKSDLSIMEKVLRDKAGVPDDNIKRWVFGGENLAAAVAEANQGNASCVYIYISCHVTKGEKKLSTQKGAALSAQAVSNILDDLKACSVFVIIDGCTLGANYNEKILQALANRTGPLNPHPPGTLGVFTSSSRDKCANMHGGICAGSDWTQALVKCWRDAGADQDRSGSVDIIEAFDWVLTNGCEKARRGDPQQTGMSIPDCGQNP